MRTIVVDDEELSMRQFEIECAQVREIDLVGTFTNPLEALEYASSHPVDFALLDIEMPQMNGIELARRLDALNRAKLLAKGQDKRIFIRTFGRFDVFIDDKLVKFSNSKSKELLALCVDRLGGEVTMEEAVDKLWPEKDYDSRVKALYRKAVIGIHGTFEEYGIEGVFCNHRGRCYLKSDELECDYFEYMKNRGEGKYHYKDEYMFDYSWAEETNARLMGAELERE